MKITNKKLSVCIFIYAVISLLYCIYNVINVIMADSFSYFYVAKKIIASVILFIVGYTVFSGNKNLKTTLIAAAYAVIASIPSVSIPLLLFIVLVLCARFVKQISFTEKLWFLPAAAGAIFTIIDICKRITDFINFYNVSYYLPLDYLLQGILLPIIINIIEDICLLALGYWFIKCNDCSKKDTQILNNRKNIIAYYQSLLDQGVLTQDEFNEKINNM